MYGVIGFSLFMYSVMSTRSAYSDGARGKSSEEDEPLAAESQYQDLDLSLVRLFVVLIVQTILIWMYAQEMVKIVPLSYKAYKYWLCSIPMQIIARELMGRSFCAELRLWYRLLHAKEGSIVQRGDDDANAKTFKAHYPDFLARAMMSYYANCLCMA